MPTDTGTDEGGGMETRTVTNAAERRRIARLVLEDLPDWFGNVEAREEYIQESADLPLFAAYDGDRPVGFLCLKETGSATAEIHVMGVLGEYHRKGAGRSLVNAAREAARRKGYSFLQVKTVQMGRYDDYDETNRFYRAMGFKEFEVFTALWDEANPCQVYVMYLG